MDIGSQSLKELTIGSGIANMGKISFVDCGDDLADITVLRDIPPVYDGFGYELFSNGTYQNATLHIPAGSESAYAQAAVWKDFLNIRGEEFTGINRGVSDGKYSVTERHYDLSGQQVKPETPGIHIVRKQNGSSYKQLIK